MLRLVLVACILSMTAYCSSLKAGPWLTSATGPKPFLGFPIAGKYGADVHPNATTLWGCAYNETLVLYTIWINPKSKSKSKAIRLPGLRPAARARCCPNPGAEEHLIPGEVCPLGRKDGQDIFLLPQNLTWASASPPCASSAPPMPACCSEDPRSYCQFIHDRTQQGEICPIGRPVCCRRPLGKVPFQVTAKGVCSGAGLYNNTGSATVTSTDEQSLPVKRFKKLRNWIKDQGIRKPVAPKKPYYRPPQNETSI